MARKMRDSGVEWIGEVPEGWEIGRIRSLFREVSERYDTQSNNQLPLLSVSEYYGVAKREDKIKTGEVLVRAESLDGYKVCRAGDIVSNIMLAWKGALGFSPLSGIVSPAYSVYRPLKDVCSKYFHYLFRTDRYTDVFNKYSTGIIASRLRLYSPEFYAIPAIIPPLPEQRRIADYLDEKCAAIDGAVDELKRGIEDCKAWKKAIIFEAVTGKKRVTGNGERGMGRVRDSGIPWIGEIPEGWEVSRVKNECINFDSLREPISAENRENKQGLYDYYGASGVIDKIDDYNVDDTVLLIGEDGANLRMRNLPLVYKATGKFWVNNHAHILKPKEGRDYDFMAYALEAGDYNDFITGSAQPKLSQANLMAYPIALPPLPEQQAIANYLDEKCAAIDALVAEKEKLIADLEAYKKSRIFELVTGKREVA